MSPEEYPVVAEQISLIEDECHQMLFEFARAGKNFGSRQALLEDGTERLWEDIHAVNGEDLRYIFESM